MKKSLVYTRTGDRGTTSLVDGSRVSKNSARLEAYGTVDELNSQIGVLLSAGPVDDDSRRFLTWVQNRLFDLGSYLATDADSDAALAAKMFPGVAEAVATVEREIDRLDSRLPAMRSFVLPQGAPSAAAAHVARTVARRAERRILDLADTASVDPSVIVFINRLSDYLFVLARFNNVISGNGEIIWQKDCVLTQND